MTSVSIAMATYNGGKHLSGQLKSIAAQTRLPDELIVCDDLSTDHTIEILSDFAQTAPFEVKLFRNEKNLGYALNFERAIALCQGELVLLSDQDDYWYVDKVHLIECTINQNPSAWLLIHDAKIGDENLETTGLTVVGQVNTVGISSVGHQLGCCMAFRSLMKPLIIPVPWPRFGHDGWINTLARALGRRLFIEDTLQIYRRHSSNTSHHITMTTERLSRWELLKGQLSRKYLKKDPREASEGRIAQLRALRERILSNENYLKNLNVLDSELSCAIEEIERRVEANLTRQFIQVQRPIRRLSLATAFYLRGGYTDFEGIKSLARDLVR